MDMIRTVSGDIEIENIGTTLCHEHLRIDLKKIFQEPEEKIDYEKAYSQVTLENLGWIRANYINNLDNLGLYEEKLIVDELLLFKESGGKTLVEVTPVDIGRDPNTLLNISKRTGLNVIMGSGYYVYGTHPPNLKERSVENIAEEIINDILIGANGTNIKSGIIGEIGCSWPLHEDEKKVLIAASKAQKEIGCALTIHPGRHHDAPIEILEVIDKAGGKISRTIIGHIDRTFSTFDRLLEFAKNGSYIEFDMFGLESAYYPFSDVDMPNDGKRIEFILNLIDQGYLNKILVSHDIAFKHSLVKYGGFGYAHILKNAVPKMLKNGLKQNMVNKILEDNPKDALKFFNLSNK